MPSIATQPPFPFLPGERHGKNDTSLPTPPRTATASVDRCHSLAVVAQSLSLPPKAFIPSFCVCVLGSVALLVVFCIFLSSSLTHTVHFASNHHGSIQRRLTRHERCFKRQRSRRVEASQQAVQDRTTKDHRQKEKTRHQSPPNNPFHFKQLAMTLTLSPRQHTEIRKNRRKGTPFSRWAHRISPSYAKKSQGSVAFLSTSSTSVSSRARPSLVP